MDTRAPEPRVLLIDNYDSFTYNLAQVLAVIGARVEVARNDRIDLAGVAALGPTHLVLSPGPKAPADAGICLDVVRAWAGRVPILGVCLGHQVINEVFGGRTARALHPTHGKTSWIRTDGRTIYAGLPAEIEVCRYHSLVADPAALGADLEVSARTAEGEVMGVRHRHLPIEGVQFHPESFRTPHGPALLTNFFRVYPGAA